MLRKDDEPFAEGVASAVHYITADSRPDHLDLLLDEINERGGLELEALVAQKILEADEGNVVRVFRFSVSFGPEGAMTRRSYLRIIDLQAGPGFMMSDERIAELSKGGEEVTYNGTASEG